MDMISFTDGIHIAGNGKAAKIFADTADEGVIRAARDLCRDIEAVTGGKAELTDNTEQADIIIRTEPSPLWECFELNTESNRLVITGSDKRGTVYGIYEVSRRIGVSPWYWWADVTPQRHEKIYIKPNAKYTSKEPSVKYRGIFINDEESFALWALNQGDLDFTDTYKRVYELILRLRANTLWPAMHHCSPHFHKNIENAKNAEMYGIIIGSSHCEQMLRNNQFEYAPFEEKWTRKNPDKPLYRIDMPDMPSCTYVYTDKNPDTGERVYNNELLYDYWRESVINFGTAENLYTVGMRGLHDWPWQSVGAETPLEKAHILEKVIDTERKILEEVTGKRAADIPQIFVPYKEILEVYNAGMTVPDDVTLMWTNDNFGYIRQLPTNNERKRAGGAGMYYHLSYCGSPKSYLWLSTTPFALMREELTKAYNSGVDRVWIANVGDIKAAEKQTEYFLDLAYDIEANQDIHHYIEEKSKRDFGFDNKTASELADIELEFQRLSFARKPEHFMRNLFNLKAFNDEGQRYIAKYDRILKRSEEIYKNINEDLRDAYFEFYLYSLRSCRNTAYQYITMDEQKQHLLDGYKNAAEKYIYLSDCAFYAIMEDTRLYHTLQDGKWDYIMNSAHGFYIKRDNGHPLLECEKEWGDMRGIGAAYENMTFSGYAKDRRFIDIFNKFWQCAKWELSVEYDFIKPSKRSGIVISDERIWINIDYDNAPKENIKTNLTLTSDAGDKIIIPLEVNNDCISLQNGVFAEVNGYVSIMAEHTSRPSGGWNIEEYLGRESSSIKSVGTDAAEYDIYFENTGIFETEIYRIPTLDERGGIFFGIGLNDEPPEIIKCTSKSVEFSDGTDSWGMGVLNNCERLTAHIEVKNKGISTLKLYPVSSGAIIEKIIIWTGEKIHSYFGPPESMVKSEEYKNDNL